MKQALCRRQPSLLKRKVVLKKKSSKKSFIFLDAVKNVKLNLALNFIGTPLISKNVKHLYQEILVMEQNGFLSVLCV